MRPFLALAHTTKGPLISAHACWSIAMTQQRAESHLARNIMAEGTRTGPAERPGITQEKLPKLSSAEFRAYNSMAEHMEIFVG